MSRPSLLEVEGLSADYGAVTALHGVDLNVGAGEIVALIGSNGAGKSTLLLAIAGAVSARRGCLRWRGGPLAGPLHRRARLGIALLSEQGGIFRRLTVRANLELGSGGVARALDHFPELEPLLDRRAGLLSGGEQQMVRLGRTLAASPALLLADELSLGLAPQIVDRLLGELRAAADAGVSTLLVEQHTDQALAIAERAYVLVRGTMQLSSVPAAELRDDAERLRSLYLDAP